MGRGNKVANCMTIAADRVRESARHVAAHSMHVSINEAALLQHSGIVGRLVRTKLTG